MGFFFRPMQKQDALVVTGWRYEAPYSFYNADSDPDDLAELLNCAASDCVYYAVVDEAGKLVGFFCFDHNVDTVEIGLGLRPDLTGQGIGRSFVVAGLAFAQKQFAPALFRLAVATFNERAIQVYSALGFQRGRIFLQNTNGGEFEFVEMTRYATKINHGSRT
ncbi:MAG: GNAT family N-acetyltransferase [Chloroflexales bacterium]|nr:GNAT family N-acetyltransferase [Chloroflexales bacterium]